MQCNCEDYIASAAARLEAVKKTYEREVRDLRAQLAAERKRAEKAEAEATKQWDNAKGWESEAAEQHGHAVSAAAGEAYWQNKWNKAQARVEQAEQRVATLEAELAACRKALKFYADTSNWTDRLRMVDFSTGLPRIEADGGKIARAALQPPATATATAAPERPRERCKKCGGVKIEWSAPGELRDCPHCKGSGDEPGEE